MRAGLAQERARLQRPRLTPGTPLLRLEAVQAVPRRRLASHAAHGAPSPSSSVHGEGRRGTRRRPRLTSTRTRWPERALRRGARTTPYSGRSTLQKQLCAVGVLAVAAACAREDDGEVQRARALAALAVVYSSSALRHRPAASSAVASPSSPSAVSAAPRAASALTAADAPPRREVARAHLVGGEARYVDARVERGDRSAAAARASSRRASAAARRVVDEPFEATRMRLRRRPRARRRSPRRAAARERLRERARPHRRAGRRARRHR